MPPWSTSKRVGRDNAPRRVVTEAVQGRTLRVPRLAGQRAEAAAQGDVVHWRRKVHGDDRLGLDPVAHEGLQGRGHFFFAFLFLSKTRMGNTNTDLTRMAVRAEREETDECVQDYARRMVQAFESKRPPYDDRHGPTGPVDHEQCLAPEKHAYQLFVSSL